MIVRGVDVENDWFFGKGRNDYRSNYDAVVQNIKTRLKSFIGDCFFAVNDGIDWFNLLGAKNQLALELAVRSVILNTQGVSGIVSFSSSLDRESRIFTMTYEVNTIYTSGVVSENLSSSVSFLLTESGDVLTTEDGSPIVPG